MLQLCGTDGTIGTGAQPQHLTVRAHLASDLQSDPKEQAPEGGAAQGSYPLGPLLERCNLCTPTGSTVA